MTHRSKKKTEPLQPIYPNLKELADKLEGKFPEETINLMLHNEEDEEVVQRKIRLRLFPIAVGVPMDETMFSDFFSNWSLMSHMPWDNVLTTASTFISEARNKIHNWFLEKTTAPYLLMLDSDVLPPPDVIERLLKHDLPIVAGWYRKKEKFWVKDETGEEKAIQRPAVYDFVRFDDEIQEFRFMIRGAPGKGLEKVGGFGAGCVLLKREVCEKVGKSPYSLRFGGEDMSFCRKLEGCGYDLYVDWDCECCHLGVWKI